MVWIEQEKDSVLDNLTEDSLRYAARARCRCGAGLAYIESIALTHELGHAWYCSDALLKAKSQTIEVVKEGGLFGGGIIRDDDGIEHDQSYPFMSYEIKSEDQPSAKGATTRPVKAD